MDAPTPTGVGDVGSAQGGGSQPDRLWLLHPEAYGLGLDGHFHWFDGVWRGARWPGRSGEAADYEGDEGPGDVGLAVGDEPLVVAHVSACSHDPRDCPLDSPPLRQDGEASLVFAAGHRLEGDAEEGVGPVDEA